MDQEDVITADERSIDEDRIRALMEQYIDEEIRTMRLELVRCPQVSDPPPRAALREGAPIRAKKFARPLLPPLDQSLSSSHRPAPVFFGSPLLSGKPLSRPGVNPKTCRLNYGPPTKPNGMPAQLPPLQLPRSCRGFKSSTTIPYCTSNKVWRI
jgi:hypothetical protein